MHLTPLKEPYHWSAAHSPVIFEYDYQQRTVVYGGNANGDFTLLLNQPFSMPVTAGSIFYITDGVYRGFHTVKEILLGIGYKLNTPYINNGVGLKVKHIYPYTFLLYKGFQGFDNSYNLEQYLPYTFVARFKPEPTLNGTLKFDISGYLQTIFEMDKMVEFAGIAGNTVIIPKGGFNQYSLLLENPYGTLRVGRVLNSSLPQDELQANYAQTGRHLYPGLLKPLHKCGPSVYFKIMGDMLTVDIHTATVPLVGTGIDFDPSYNNDYKTPTSG